MNMAKRSLLALAAALCAFASVAPAAAWGDDAPPFAAALSSKKLSADSYTSILFGKVTFYEGSKPSADKSLLLALSVQDKPDSTAVVEVPNGQAFLLQAAPGSYRIDSFKLKGRYYRVGQGFRVAKGQSFYLGSFELRAKGEKRAAYEYEYRIDAGLDAKALGKNPDIARAFEAQAPADFAKGYEKATLPSYSAYRGEAKEPKTLPKAARDGDLATAAELLKAKADVEEPDSEGHSPLMLALNGGNSDIAKLLIAKGAQAARKDGSGWTPLLYAFYGGAFDVAPLLIEKGAEVNGTVGGGWTPIMFCLRYDKGGNLRLLVEKGAEINAAKDDGTTPLMLALEYQDAATAAYLVEKGAKVDAKDSDGWTVLYYALRYGKDELARGLIEKGQGLDETTKDGWTPLMCALRNGQLGNAELIYAKAPRLEARNASGWSALNFALRNGAKDLARRMIESGMDPSKATAEGYTPLMQALANDMPDNARLLMAKGADIEARNKDGWTALMYALQYGQTDIARTLADKSKTLDAADNDGWTALMFALRYGQTDVAARLLDRGVKVDPRDGEGWTALHYALRYDAAALGTRLISMGAPFDYPNSDGWTPLMVAIRYAQGANARLLVQKGAALAPVNNNGWSALMLALDNDQADIAKLLVDKGAPLNAANAAGGNALSIAKAHGQTELASLIAAKLAAQAPAPAPGQASGQAGGAATTKWERVLPKYPAMAIVDESGIDDASGISTATLQIGSSKAAAYAYFRDALPRIGWTITQAASAAAESGSVEGNANVWGVLGASNGPISLVLSIDSDKFTGGVATRISACVLKQSMAPGLASDILSRIAPGESRFNERFASKDWAVTLAWAKNEGRVIKNTSLPGWTYTYSASTGFHLVRVRLDLERVNGKPIKQDFIPIKVQARASDGTVYPAAFAGTDSGEYYDFTKGGNQSLLIPVQAKCTMDYVFGLPDGSSVTDFLWPGIDPIGLWVP
jgi:ankyrin repeat protein